jgi:hypothetical protein
MSAYCKVTKQIQSLEWLRYNADQYWYMDELRKIKYKEEEAAIVEKAAKAEALIIEKAAKLQAYLKKETPEEYKARKESQAQRAVKKETPEEYAARTEYMKKKEQLELEAETQRLFNKGEKKHQDHLNYLYIQEKKAEREAERAEKEEMRQINREQKEAYNNSEEGRAKAEKTRNWNTPEEIRKREKNQEDWKIHQQKHLDSYIARCEHQYKNKDKIRETHFNTGKWEDKVDRNYKHAMSLR